MMIGIPHHDPRDGSVTTRQVPIELPEFTLWRDSDGSECVYRRHMCTYFQSLSQTPPRISYHLDTVTSVAKLTP